VDWNLNLLIEFFSLIFLNLISSITCNRLRHYCTLVISFSAYFSLHYHIHILLL